MGEEGMLYASRHIISLHILVGLLSENISHDTSKLSTGMKIGQDTLHIILYRFLPGAQKNLHPLTNAPGPDPRA